MKMVKSLLLGSAAGLVAMAGAQAADLSVKAKPVQYVKVCSLNDATPTSSGVASQKIVGFGYRAPIEPIINVAATALNLPTIFGSSQGTANVASARFRMSDSDFRVTLWTGKSDPFALNTERIRL
jgi:O-glycosyl hydrolase